MGYFNFNLLGNNNLKRQLETHGTEILHEKDFNLREIRRRRKSSGNWENGRRLPSVKLLVAQIVFKETVNLQFQIKLVWFNQEKNRSMNHLITKKNVPVWQREFVSFSTKTGSRIVCKLFRGYKERLPSRQRKARKKST